MQNYFYWVQENFTKINNKIKREIFFFILLMKNFLLSFFYFSISVNEQIKKDHQILLKQLFKHYYNYYFCFEDL